MTFSRRINAFVSRPRVLLIFLRLCENHWIVSDHDSDGLFSSFFLVEKFLLSPSNGENKLTVTYFVIALLGTLSLQNNPVVDCDPLFQSVAS